MGTGIDFSDILALAPLLLLLAGGSALILLESFFPNVARRGSLALALLTFIAAIIAVFLSPASQSPLLTNWLHFDGLSRYFSLLFLSVGAACCLLTAPFFKRFDISRGEFFFFLISSVAGLLLISSSADFLTLFIGLETLSIALYILCAYVKRWHRSREAATKYFLLGALSAGFLLYGIALIYGATGTTRFSEIYAKYQGSLASFDTALLYAGAAFVTLGLAFKAAVVPVHIWAPDVYDGAPTPVTAFMAVATKIAAFAAFIRIFMQGFHGFSPVWQQGIALLAVPTLIYANMVAMKQVQLRRFFAYSGIAHAGLLLLPLAAGTPQALESLLFYFPVYALATLGCFAILAFIDSNEEGVFLHDITGLFTRSPALAIIFAILLLTLAGLPPTAGFLAKFYLFKATYEAGYSPLVILGLLTSIFSAVYYLRITGLLFAKEPVEESKPECSLAACIVAIACVAGVFALSVYPQPLLDMLATITK